MYVHIIREYQNVSQFHGKTDCLCNAGSPYFTTRQLSISILQSGTARVKENEKWLAMVFSFPLQSFSFYYTGLYHRKTTSNVVRVLRRVNQFWVYWEWIIPNLIISQYREKRDYCVSAKPIPILKKSDKLLSAEKFSI